MPQSERKFGAIPERAKSGPIDVKNFCYRSEEHCSRKSAERGGVHPTISRDSPEYAEWMSYFEKHLGGLPLAARAVRDGNQREMTVPELHPEWFDASYHAGQRALV